MRAEIPFELEQARFDGGGALDGLHRGLIEIVLRFCGGAGDFGNGNGAGELLVLEFEIGGEGLIGVAIDGVENASTA